MKCLRCQTEMKYLKTYRFDSQNQNRGFLGTLLDVEEHLIFDVHICPRCKHSEFFYKGAPIWVDDSN